MKAFLFLIGTGLVLAGLVTGVSGIPVKETMAPVSIVVVKIIISVQGLSTLSWLWQRRGNVPGHRELKIP